MLIVRAELSEFDWDGLGEEIEDALEEAVQEIAEEIEWEVRREASGSLKESLSSYLDGLSVEADGLFADIQLTGGLAKAVEEGSDPFDLKPGFLGGALSRVIPLTGRQPLRFRTAPYSKNSPPWVHPGIKARNFISQAVEKVMEVDVDRIIDEKIRTRIKF